MVRTARARSEDMASRLALARSYTKNGSGEPLSTSALAHLAGLVRTHVYLIESRKRTNFTIDTVERLATVLGVSLDWLYAGRGTPPDPESVLVAVRKSEAAFTAKPTKPARAKHA
jgi:transcriptional regulator with XRE-family HTH domain